MGTELLALNDRNTEVTHFSSTLYGQGHVLSCDPHVGAVSISPSNATCNLGHGKDHVELRLIHYYSHFKLDLTTHLFNG